MNQYKFRGKRKDNGEWVVGLLVMGVFKDYLIQSFENGFHYTVVVIPETVGMWTGLKDKYGQELYEGDIYQPEHCTTQRFKIMFLSGAFVGGKNEEVCSPIGWIDEDQSNQNWICKVGNIHDNPELTPLKGERFNMNNNIEPKEKAEGQEEQTQEIAATESAAQDAAVGADSKEVTEG